jgi:hypothetical protein
MNLPKLNTADAVVGGLILLYVIALAFFPMALPQERFLYAFSEQGPFERLSIAGWLLIPAVILVRIRPLGMRAVAFGLLAILFAAREADWHKAFTADSILKTNYYRHAVAPFEEKLLGGIAAFIFIALVLYVGFIIARFLLLRGGSYSRSGFWLLAGAALVVAGKVVDRAPALLFENFGTTIAASMQLYVSAFEEGLEMIHPLILCWSIWISQHERRYL